MIKMMTLILWERTSVACLQTLTVLIGECMIDMMTLVVVGEEECCVSTTIDCIDWRVFDRDDDTCCCGRGRVLRGYNL